MSDLRPLSRREGPGIAPHLRMVRQDDALLNCYARHMAKLARQTAYETRLIRARAARDGEMIIP